MQAERRAFELTQAQAMRPLPPVPAVTPATLPVTPAVTPLDDSERKELEDKIEDLEEEAIALKEEVDEANRERNEEKMKQQMAAKRISMALDMGTVVSANKASGFVIFKPSLSAPNHQPGTTLSIRRNSGILGEIIVERLAEDGHYIATMKPQVFAPDGYPSILPGDTVIVNPN